VDYSYKLSWINKARYLPLKEEYYDKKGDLYKVFTADEINDMKGIPIALTFSSWEPGLILHLC
jgi:outer membrane lipoprotein-sorting protein